ncbi:Shedu anti-phage system protein SduA domain-containing protein [Sorangium sp. So ce834]|uniref:Shedu immune nuclease family protein n=1 Tax=Sorangium sp. So ce834 TaxID=3133321 RepID=UPI003F5F425F
MNEKNAPKVLLVEDNKATAGDFLRVLQPNGFAVEHALDAAEALHKAATFGPDVVLLDLQIPSAPGLSDEDVEHGFRVLDALLAADPFRPVCIVTAHNQPELIRRAMRRTHGAPFVFKDDDLRRALPKAVNVALASPAFKMSRTVREFRALVDRNEPEDVYRKFIHQHWGAILGPEYQDVRSPYPITRGGEIDLLAIRWDGFPDLWELKRPSDPVFKDYNGWLHHSLECARALGQLMSYYDAAEKEPRGPLGYDGRRGITVHLQRPRGFVVIGRYQSDAERERLRLENGFLAGLAVLTYDDLIERAEQFLTFLQQHRNGDDSPA